MTLQFRWHSCSKDDFPFKRPKVQRACHLCRQKKMRCDGQKPCKRCQGLAQECIYDDKPSPRRLQQQQPKRRARKIVQRELLNSDGSSQSSRNDDDEEEAETTTEDHHHHHQQTTSSRRHDFQQHSHNSSSQWLSREDKNRIYCRRNLKRISFSNTIYESMRQQQSYGKSYLYSTQLAPLLLDFFNLTAQPHGIWSRFTTLFRTFCFHPTAQSAFELNQQTLALFATHNLLYSALFDFPALTAALELGGSVAFTAATITSDTAPVTAESLLIYAIFALVLHAAYQSLSTKVPKLSDDLLNYATRFYREAHRRFIALTFPATGTSSPLSICPTNASSSSSSPSCDKTMLFSLAQAAVLLTHYQCTAVCEGQAHMTLQMGFVFAQRCALFTEDVSAGGIDTKRRKALATILSSWRAWLSFYLHLEDWPTKTTTTTRRDDYCWAADDDAPIEPRSCPTSDQDLETFQQWAMDAASAYGHFLLQLSVTKMRMSEVKKWVDMLQMWSAPSTTTCDHDSSHRPNRISDPLSSPCCLPASVLLLFHRMLTIQIHLCQTSASSDVFQSVSFIGDDSDDHQAHVDSLALDLCDIAAAEIVHIVDNLTVNNHAPVASEVEQFRRSQAPITLAVLYPLSLATSTALVCLRRRRSDRSDVAHSKAAVPPPAIPAFKLQRLLNPVCSQMEAANVIYGPLREIMAAVKCSIDTTPIFTVAENARALRASDQRPITASSSNNNNVRPNISDTLHWYENFSEDGLFNEAARITPMAHPTLDIMSRNVMREKIDQEQLEKLSHSKNAISSSSNLDFYARANMDAYGVPLMSMTQPGSAATRKRAAASTSDQQQKGPSVMPTIVPGQKRQYFSAGLDLIQQQQQQQQQVPPDSSALAVKRMRTDASCSDNNESLMRSSQEMLRARDNGLSIPDMSDPAALQVYSENYILMFENPITATSTTTAVAAATDQSQLLSPNKDRSETLISSIIGNSTASGGMVGSLSTVPPKLPPPKQRNVNTKSWTSISASGQKDWNVDFQESIVETLHHQNTHAINVDSNSFASGIVDTSMMISPSTANGQPGIAVSDNNDMMYFFCGNSNSSSSTSISSEARTSQSSPATAAGQWNDHQPHQSTRTTLYKSRRSSGGNKPHHKKRSASRKSSWTPSNFPASAAVPITARNPAAAASFDQDPWLQTAAKMSSTDGIVWEE